MARLYYCGSYWDREDGRSALGAGTSHMCDLYAGRPLLDLEISVPLSNATLSIGAQNVLDTYPDENLGHGQRRGQPLRPIRAARLQRRLPLHAHRLRVGLVKLDLKTEVAERRGLRPATGRRH